MKKPKTQTFLTEVSGTPPTSKELMAAIKMCCAELVKRTAEKESVVAKIQENTAAVEELKAGIPNPPDFQKAREKMLAEIALGRADSAALVRLDQESVDAVNKHNALVKRIQGEIKTPEETIVGLSRMDIELFRLIERLQAEEKRLWMEFFLTKAEERGAVYADLMNQAIIAMDETIVWASFHKRIGGSNLIGESIGEFSAVPLGTASTRDVLLPTDTIKSVDRYNAIEEQALADLKADGAPPPFRVEKSVRPIPRVREEGIPVGIVRPEDDKYRQTTAVTE